MLIYSNARRKTNGRTHSRTKAFHSIKDKIRTGTRSVVSELDSATPRATKSRRDNMALCSGFWFVSISTYVPLSPFKTISCTPSSFPPCKTYNFCAKLVSLLDPASTDDSNSCNLRATFLRINLTSSWDVGSLIAKGPSWSGTGLASRSA